jgi:PAS domain-containing protein
LIVDTEGQVEYANLTAEAMLASPAGVLVGLTFGRPLTGERTELDVPRRDGRPLTLEMRASPMAGGAYLVNLRDITQRVQAQAALRRAEQFSRAVLDSLSAEVAVLDERGEIVAINEAWRRAALEQGEDTLKYTGVGTNYLAACRSATADSAPEANQAGAGILNVLNGVTPHFEMEYQSHLADGGRWYLMRVTALQHAPEPGVVVWHHDVTARRRAAAAAEAERREADQQSERERELVSLQQLSSADPTPVTARTFNLTPLRQSMAEQFADLTREYAALLDRALERRVLKIEDRLSDELRRLAGQLGFLNAGPRDVMDLHLEALRTRTSAAPRAKAQAYAEEGRLLALELMGHLAAYYRVYAPPPARLTPRPAPAVSDPGTGTVS